MVLLQNISSHDHILIFRSFCFQHSGIAKILTYVCHCSLGTANINLKFHKSFSTIIWSSLKAKLDIHFFKFVELLQCLDDRPSSSRQQQLIITTQKLKQYDLHRTGKIADETKVKFRNFVFNVKRNEVKVAFLLFSGILKSIDFLY